MRFFARVIPLALALAALPSAYATSARADDAEEARHLFEAGTAAIHAGRPAEARGLLERSLALHAHPATAWNLVLALDRTNELARAREVCDALLAERYGALDDEKRAQAVDTCSALDAATPVLTLVGVGAPRVALRVDGELVGEVDDGGALARPVDPGRHTALAQVPRGVTGDEREVELDRGARIRLTLAVPEATSTNDADPLPFVLAGTGVLAVAAAIVIVVLATSGTQPIEGDFPVTATLLRAP